MLGDVSGCRDFVDQVDSAAHLHVFGGSASKHLFENLAGDFCIIECLVGIKGDTKVFGDSAELLVLSDAGQSAKCHLKGADAGDVAVDIDGA